MPKTLNDEWLDFLHNVIPSDAPDMQVQEMQKAFYAGAMSMGAAAAQHPLGLVPGLTVLMDEAMLFATRVRDEEQ